MAYIEKISIGGVDYDCVDVTHNYSQVQVSNLQSNGILLGTLTINGTNYNIYAPSGSGSGGLQVNLLNNDLVLTNLQG